MHALAIVSRTWMVALLAIALCAIFAARAVGALQAPEPVLATAPSLPGPSTAPAPPRDPGVVTARDIFCSSCAPGSATSPAEIGGLAAVLIATTVGTRPRATLRVVPTEVQGSFGLDDHVPGLGTISRIGLGSIDVIDPAGATRRLAFLDSAAPPPSSPAPTVDGVRALGGTRFEVDRDLVRRLVSTGGAQAGARVTPVMRDGEVTGLRFGAVRPDSVAAAIGLRTGDVMTSIDNEPIKTAQQVLDLYGRLDRLTGVELQGTRAGKPLAIQLTLQ
jgi:hypothetical protein